MRSAMRRRRPSAGGGEVDPDELRRAAADVEEDDAGGVRVDQRGAAGDGEPRLGLARDDLEREAGLLADAVDELRAVLGRAAGLGGDQPGAGDVAVGELGAADLERLDGADHRRLAEAAVGADPLAEPDDAREGVDDAEAVVARRGDQQAAIVGAEIERGVERPRRRCARPARSAALAARRRPAAAARRRRRAAGRRPAHRPAPPPAAAALPRFRAASRRVAVRGAPARCGPARACRRRLLARVDRRTRPHHADRRPSTMSSPFDRARPAVPIPGRGALPGFRFVGQSSRRARPDKQGARHRQVDAGRGRAYRIGTLSAARRLCAILRANAADRIGESSNGRTADSDSASLGSNPSSPANLNRSPD